MVLRTAMSGTPPGDIAVFSPPFDEQRHDPLAFTATSLEKSVGHRYAPMAAGSSVGAVGEPGAGQQLYFLTVRSQLRFETVCLSGKRDVSRDLRIFGVQPPFVARLGAVSRQRSLCRLWRRTLRRREAFAELCDLK